MNFFDKCCASLAFVLGLVFLILGAIGTFSGCQANFSLPPILGIVPAFVGWGMVRSVYVAWNMPRPQLHRQVYGAQEPLPPDETWRQAPQDGHQ